MRGKTFEELGRHFLAVGLFFLTVGLITPIFEGGLKLYNLVGLVMWLIFVVVGVHLLERGGKDD